MYEKVEPTNHTIAIFLLSLLEQPLTRGRVGEVSVDDGLFVLLLASQPPLLLEVELRHAEQKRAARNLKIYRPRTDESVGSRKLNTVS